MSALPSWGGGRQAGQTEENPQPLPRPGTCLTGFWDTQGTRLPKADPAHMWTLLMTPRAHAMDQNAVFWGTGMPCPPKLGAETALLGRGLSYPPNTPCSTELWRPPEPEQDPHDIIKPVFVETAEEDPCSVLGQRGDFGR